MIFNNNSRNKCMWFIRLSPSYGCAGGAGGSSILEGLNEKYIDITKIFLQHLRECENS